MSNKEKYHVQEMLDSTKAWDNIELLDDLNVATAKARTMNADHVAGKAVHRVIRHSDGVEMYRRGGII